MWWMILLLLMLAIAGLLWWRGRQEREWRLELAYLSRHVSDEANGDMAADTPPARVGPNLNNMRERARADEASQALHQRAQQQMQQINPRFKAAAALTEDDKNRLGSDEVLAELPIFAQALKTEPVADDGSESAASGSQPAADTEAADAAADIPLFEHAPLDDAPPAESEVGWVEPEVISLEEATRQLAPKASEAVPTAVPEVISLEEATRQLAVAEAEPPAPEPEVISLEEATRQRAAKPASEPLEVIDLDWLPPAKTPRRTPATAPAADTAAVAPAAAARPPLAVIGEEDIRSNLLRQRLARRREQGPAVAATQIVPELAVIAEDEVLANLAKTDSPVNRHKNTFRRTTVRESVIPAAARIGQSHTLKLSPVAAATAAAGNVPISTRFTPYQPTLAATPAAAEAAAETVPAPEALNEPPPAASIAVPAAAPVVHITDSPTWSISDRLTSESANSPADDDAAPLSESGHAWPASGSPSPAREPLPAQPAWGPMAVSATETPPWQTDVPVATDAAEADLPPWQLSQSQTQPQPVPPVPAAMFQAAPAAGGQITPPPAPPPAVQSPPAATSAVATQPQTAMGLALQAAMQRAPTPVPETPKLTLPGLDLLLPPQFDPSASLSEEALLDNGITIEEKLAEFKVKVSVVDAYAGPVITRYEIEPAQGVRGNQVVNLEKDLARSLGFAAIRVVETIPGKTCMGLELPNPKRQIIRLSEIFNAPVFQESRSKLTLALGQDITGEPVVTDLAKAPHLLVAGTTGSGKSVGVNAMILSMLFKATPEEVRLIMIDPKMLELSIYEGIPHLLAPVVTDMKLAANALTWCVNEMEKRYRLMSHVGVRNLAGFNQKVAEAAQRGQKLANPFSLTPDDPEPLEKLPFIVVVVDEFADLMMTAGKKIEELIARLAQKARAAGIHLILATQRPSVDVITGLIKANIPTRIAFQVSSKVDSRTILDQMGAENLLGQGDMLFLPPGTGYPRRVHGAFVADEEVHGVVEYLKQFGEPNYIDDILTAGVGEDDLFSNANSGGRSGGGEDEQDPLYDEAVAVVVKTRKASISSVQRHLRIGYNRAARLVEQMEADGIVSAAEGNGNRTVLAPDNSQLDG